MRRFDEKTVRTGKTAENVMTENVMTESVMTESVDVSPTAQDLCMMEEVRESAVDCDDDLGSHGHENDESLSYVGFDEASEGLCRIKIS